MKALAPSFNIRQMSPMRPSFLGSGTGSDSLALAEMGARPRDQGLTTQIARCSIRLNPLDPIDTIVSLATDRLRSAMRSDSEVKK